MNTFVTGGSRGIGRSIVLKLIAEGCGCAFSYVGTAEGADETMELARGLTRMRKSRPTGWIRGIRIRWRRWSRRRWMSSVRSACW